MPNIVDPDEVDKRRKQEFNPASIDVNARQSGIARALIGFNRKKLPAHPDAAIQARIQRIGESLIPEYQRKLPPDDATRIPFRFQVVDIEDVREPITFPNGIVLVPFLAVTRLTDDAQVAALLADGIAGILEKQELVDSAAHTALSTAAKWATLGINGVYLTPLAIANGQPILPLNRQVTEREKQQSGRISLWLMHQAGYDLTEAPTAWWLLAPSKPQPLENTDVPERADTLYNALGTTWREALVKQP